MIADETAARGDALERHGERAPHHGPDDFVLEVVGSAGELEEELDGIQN